MWVKQTIHLIAPNTEHELRARLVLCGRRDGLGAAPHL
jgi:hypothetical protein